MRPAQPDNLRYMTGWFLPQCKNIREARRKAEDYLIKRSKSK